MKRLVPAAVVLSLFLLPPRTALATDPAPERKAAEELLLLLRMDRNVEAMMQEMAKMVPASFPMEGASPEAEAAAKRYMEKMMALLKREMAWEKMKDRYVDLYASTFTEKELRELADFYRSPVGSAFVERMPALMEKSMAIGQETAKRLLPELMKIAGESARGEGAGKDATGK